MTRSPKSLSFILCVNMDICTKSHRNWSNSCSWHFAKKEHVKFQPNGGPEGNIGGSPKSVGFILREPLRSFQRFIVIHKSISAWTKLIDRLAKPLAWLRICELQEIMQFWHQALWGAHIANRQALKPCTAWESTAFVNYKGDVIPNYCTHKACTVRTFAPHRNRLLPICLFSSVIPAIALSLSLTANK